MVENPWLLQVLDNQRKCVVENFPTISNAKSSSDMNMNNNSNGSSSSVQPIAWRSLVRTKPVRRDMRSYDREEKRKRGELEDKRRKRVADFHKTLFLHREEFLRFHKYKRGECGKVARAVRIADEQRGARKEKESARADARRMQALRENDMEAYSQLLQETKNDRLHYILQQADTYIASINEMIIEHSRNVAMSDDFEEEEGEGAGGEEQAALGATDQSLSKASSAAKDMYRNVHRRQEIVTQPRSLTGGELKEYQLSGVQWLVSLYNNKLNGILADEMVGNLSIFFSLYLLS
jgi:ATP-dependent helicase STH1/SNF2